MHLTVRSAVPVALVCVATLGLTAGCGSTGPSTSPPPGGSTGRHHHQSGSPTPTGSGHTTATPTTTPTPTPSPVTPACVTSHLRLTVSDQGGAAGSSYATLVLTNTGSSPCALGGYPGVSYVQAPNGGPVGAPGRRNPAKPVTSVTVAPGSSAFATLQETFASNYSRSRCRPANVTGLRVYPPNQTASLYAKHPTQACASTSVNLLSVTAFVPRQ